MKRMALMKVAASSLILAATMVGCTGAAYKGGPLAASAKAPNAHFAENAEKALSTRNFAVALTQAEAAVAAQPDSGAYRTLLGRAYLANGRFVSAETAFRDAVTLGNSDPRTIVSLALIKVAQGDSVGARALLTNEMDHIPAADYGLAIAMAGDAPEGIRVLSEAIHDPSSDGKTRQNLAYAYALDGHWREAKMMAEQDVDPIAASKRVLAWAQLAQPGAEAQRVAALMGIDPRADDAGLPAHLALAPVNSTVQTAEATPEATIVQSTEQAPVETASVDVPVAKAAPAAIATVLPVRKMIQPVSIPESGKPMDVAKPVRATMTRTAFIKPLSGAAASPWVVQIGAYDSAAVAKDKWRMMAKYNTGLNAFAAVNSTATVDGRLYYRLALSGFGDRNSAYAMCQTLRSKGGQCFVRQSDPNATPDRWAVAKVKSKQLAMR
jgi:Flp pilus assembly protein TadD